MQHTHTIKAALIFTIAVLFYLVSCFSNKNKIKEESDIQACSAFYNSTGTRCAISLRNGMVLLADTTLTIIKSTQAHNGSANSSFFSLNDRYIVSGGNDSFIRIWNSTTLQLEKERNVGFSPFTSVMGDIYFGTCGESAYTYFESFTDSNVVIFDTTHHTDKSAFHLFFVDKDSTIVISSGNRAYEYNIPQKKTLRSYNGHTDKVYCVMPDNTKTKYITGSADSTISIYDRYTTNRINHSFKLDSEVFVVCFSMDNKFVAASTRLGSIYFLNLSLNSVLKKIKAFNGQINTIHFSPNGSRILAGSEGGGVKIFDVQTGKELFTLNTFN